MTYASTASTSMAAKPSKDSSTHVLLDKKIFPFAKPIGKLLYCSNCTRPDSTMAVNHLSRYMTSATVRHLEQAKRVLRYLSGTLNHGITYNSKLPSTILMWQDASFADGDARRCRTSFVAMMCGSMITWDNKLQPTVALSTVEAKYT
jgi:hypothetical protein